MNIGRFFRLDLEASCLTDGLAVFSYHQVKNYQGKDEVSDRGTPYFPFYLIFSQEGVKFYVHFFDDKTNRHRHSLILELPISSNIEIHDNLTQRLNDIFYVHFPYNPDKKEEKDEPSTNTHRGEINKETLVKDDKNPNKPKNKENEPLTNILRNEINKDSFAKDDKNPTYSSLPIFRISNEQFKEESKAEINVFLRKLFLDFLFDVEHSDVFKNSAFYNEVYVKLKENFLYNAIDNKAEYYYQRKLAKIISKDNSDKKKENSNEKNEDSEKKKENSEKINEISAGNFLEAEKRWIDSVTDNRSEIAFEESDWFDNPDTELKRVFCHNKSFYQGISKIKDEELKRSDLLGFFKQKQKGKSESEKRLENTLYKIYKSNAKKSSDWFVKKYSFSGTPLIWGKWVWMLLTVIIALCVSLFYFDVNLKSLFEKYLLKIIVLFIVGIIVISILKKITKHLTSPHLLGLLGFSNTIMPRLLAAIITAWFTLTVSEDVVKGFFDNEVICWMNGLILCITFYFVYNEVSKRAPYLTRFRKFVRVACFIFISIIYSFIVGVVMLDFFGSRYFDRQDFLEDFYISYVFPENRDNAFFIPEKSQISFLQNVFCSDILFRYTPNAKDSMSQRIFDKSDLSDIPRGISQFIDSSALIIDLESNYKNIMGNDTVQDSVIYKRFAALTLLCIHEFVKDTASIETIFEQVTNNSIIDTRLTQVEHLLSKKIEIDVTDTIEVEKLWKKFLSSADHPVVYRKGLEYISHKENTGEALLSKVCGFTISKSILIQFAFVAMFVGVFLQFMLSDRAVNDPL